MGLLGKRKETYTPILNWLRFQKLIMVKTLPSEICSVIVENAVDIYYSTIHKKNTKKILKNIEKCHFTIGVNLYYYFNLKDLKKIEITLCKKCGDFITCHDGVGWRAFCFCDVSDFLPSLEELFEL